jgi:ubiquinone/menaquinone biosynthesis C-methylase UbiE
MLSRWLIKLGFHLLYYQMAWTYDLVAWSVSFGQWAAWRKLALQFLQPGPILELAYGTGGLFVDMLEAGYQPVGVDLSPYMAHLAGRRLHRRNIPVRLSQAKAQALPFPSNHFANVVATFPTDYIFEGETLAEIHRVLEAPPIAKNNTAGRLIIVIEGQLRGPWPIRSFVEWLYKVTGQRKFPPFKPLSLFEEHNFETRWEMAEHRGARARLLIAGKYVTAKQRTKTKLFLDKS